MDLIWHQAIYLNGFKGYKGSVLLSSYHILKVKARVYVEIYFFCRGQNQDFLKIFPFLPIYLLISDLFTLLIQILMGAGTCPDNSGKGEGAVPPPPEFARA